MQYPGKQPINLKDLGLTLEDLGIEVRIDVTGTEGEPIFWDVKEHGRMILFLHPIDFYWAEYGDIDPFMAHDLVMDWMMRDLDEKCDRAVARLYEMYVDPEVGA